MQDSDRRETVSQDGGGLGDGECLDAKWHQLSGALPAASTGYGASVSEPWHHCGCTADGGRPGHARAARKLRLGGAVGLPAVRGWWPVYAMVGFYGAESAVNVRKPLIQRPIQQRREQQLPCHPGTGQSDAQAGHGGAAFQLARGRV